MLTSLPGISAASIALVTWVVTGNFYLSLFVWALESIACIPRDVKYSFNAPITWGGGWIPPGDGKAGIGMVAGAKVIGLVVGLLLPIAGSSPIVTACMLAMFAIRVKNPLWIISSIAINILYLISKDCVLMGTGIISALTHTRGSADGPSKTAPNATASIMAILSAMIIGNAPGINSASFGALIDGCPLWSLGFIEAYIEGCTLGRLFRGQTTAKGFIGAIETEMILGSCILALVGGFLLGLLLIKPAEAVADKTKNFWFVTELQFWVVVCLLNDPHRPLVVGALMVLRAISATLNLKSGLLIPVVY